MRVDVRVIAATNINMKEAIARKTFREDLYYRLNGFSLSIPPLCERREEIPLLASYFMRKVAKKYGRNPAAALEPAAGCVFTLLVAGQSARDGERHQPLLHPGG